MLRITVITSTSLLALLAIATAGLWGRSFWTGDQVGGILTRHLTNECVSWTLSVDTGRGGVRLYYSRVAYPDTAVSRPYWGLNPPGLRTFHIAYVNPQNPATQPNSRQIWSFFGFARQYETWKNFQDATVHAYVVPLPLVTLLLAIPSMLVWLGPYRRARRLRNNLCVKCGYDLRATPDRCPECGEVL